MRKLLRTEYVIKSIGGDPSKPYYSLSPGGAEASFGIFQAEFKKAFRFGRFDAACEEVFSHDLRNVRIVAVKVYAKTKPPCSDRQTDVKEFFRIAGYEYRLTPGSDIETHADVRRIIRCIFEEAFELLEEAFGHCQSSVEQLEYLREELFALISRGIEPLSQNWPKIARECIDIEYYTEGLLLRLGIKSQPVWDLVHAANMKKAGGPRREDGKLLKPEGWQEPDIKAEIDRQHKG